MKIKRKFAVVAILVLIISTMLPLTFVSADYPIPPYHQDLPTHYYTNLVENSSYLDVYYGVLPYLGYYRYNGIRLDTNYDYYWEWWEWEFNYTTFNRELNRISDEPPEGYYYLYSGSIDNGIFQRDDVVRLYEKMTVTVTFNESYLPEGYAFRGFADIADNDINSTSSNNPMDFVIMKDENDSYQAKDTKLQLKALATYIDDDGTLLGEDWVDLDFNVESGSYIGVEYPNPPDNPPDYPEFGKYFIGWSTTPGIMDSTGCPVYNDVDEGPIVIVASINEPTTYYAVYEEPDKYFSYLSGEHGSIVGENPDTYSGKYSKDLVPDPPEIIADNGWEFTGWEAIPQMFVLNKVYEARYEPVPYISITQESNEAINVYLNHHYEVKVVNDGVLTLYNGIVYDDKFGISGSFKILEPGENLIFSDSYRVKLNDMPSMVNIATVVAYDSEGREVTVSAEKDVQVLPALESKVNITLDADVANASKGDEVEFMIEVNNSGFTVLKNLMISSSELGFVRAINTLYVDETQTFSITKLIDDGLFTAEATISGVSIHGEAVNDKTSIVLNKGAEISQGNTPNSGGSNTAEGLTDDEWKVIETLGILIGSDEDGVTEEYLDSIATRAQAALIGLRLKGNEKTALEFNGVQTFADAEDASEFWQPILSYLKSTPDAGWNGYEDGSFKPNSAIKGIEFTKVLLVYLGYVEGVDFTYPGTMDFAATIGLGVLAEKADVDLSIKDVVLAVIEVLGK